MDERLHLQEAFEALVIDTDIQDTVQEAGGSSRRIRVVAEAIHEGVTRNYHDFCETELRKALKTWTTPYPKPVMKHHETGSGFFSQASDPLGRVMDAKMVKSIHREKSHAHQLTLEVSDPEAVQKVEDQRYMTLSIGASVGSAVCSVCEADWIKNREYCEHQPGETYKKDKKSKEAALCTVRLGDIRFNEVSFVNVPADEDAQILHVEPIQESQAGEVTPPMSKPQDEEQTEEEMLAVAESLDVTGQEIIDDLDGLANADESDEGDEPPAEKNETSDPTDADDMSDPLDAAILEQLDVLSQAQSDLSDRIVQLEESTASLRQDLEGFVGLTKASQSGLLTQNIQLAKLSRQQMAERLADFAIIFRDGDAPTWEEALEHALTLSSKDMAKAIKEQVQLASSAKQRTVVRVEPQGLGTQTMQDDDEEETPAGSKDPDFQEFSRTIIGGMIDRLSSVK